jgi:hypothetical protein
LYEFDTNLFLLVEARKDLLRKDLRRKLFYLFASWSGRFGMPFESAGKYNSLLKEEANVKEFEFSALRVGQAS